MKQRAEWELLCGIIMPSCPHPAIPDKPHGEEEEEDEPLDVGK